MSGPGPGQPIAQKSTRNACDDATTCAGGCRSLKNNLSVTLFAFQKLRAGSRVFPRDARDGRPLPYGAAVPEKESRPKKEIFKKKTRPSKTFYGRYVRSLRSGIYIFHCSVSRKYIFRTENISSVTHKKFLTVESFF